MLQTGQIIKELREKNGFSQEVLAGYLSIKREMISYYETGSREVPLEVMEKLAILFGVDLEIFFSEHPEDAIAEMAFAFRANDLREEDLQSIAEFKKILKNYQRMVKLESLNVKR